MDGLKMSILSEVIRRIDGWKSAHKKLSARSVGDGAKLAPPLKQAKGKLIFLGWGIAPIRRKRRSFWQRLFK